MPIILHQDVFRPAREPTPALPLGVRSVGHYKLNAPFNSTRKTLTFVQLFWCAAGSGTIQLKCKPQPLQKNQVAVCFPGMPHDYRTDCGCWELYWMTLDGPLAAATITAFGMEAEVRAAGTPPVNLFRQLMKIIPHSERRNELRASAAAYAILTHAAGSHHQPSDEITTAALAILNRRWNEPTMNLKKLAADLAVAYTTLCFRFTNSMGLSPAAYLARLRVQNAIAMLQSSKMTINEIAAQCGYADPNYFCRVIRRVTHHAPSELRP